MSESDLDVDEKKHSPEDQSRIEYLQNWIKYKQALCKFYLKNINLFLDYPNMSSSMVIGCNLKKRLIKKVILDLEKMRVRVEKKDFSYARSENIEKDIDEMNVKIGETQDFCYLNFGVDTSLSSIKSILNLCIKFVAIVIVAGLGYVLIS